MEKLDIEEFSLGAHERGGLGFSRHPYSLSERRILRKELLGILMGDENDDDLPPPALEEAGALEADVGATFDQKLANIDPRLRIDIDPYAHAHLRPEMMFIREELRQAKWQTLAVRRTALKKLLIKDFITEDCELRNMSLAYAPPDP